MAATKQEVDCVRADISGPPDYVRIGPLLFTTSRSRPLCLLWGSPSKTLAANTGAVNSIAHKAIAAKLAPSANPIKLTATIDPLSAAAFITIRLRRSREYIPANALATGNTDGNKE